ncbi:uncharacterized protein LOC135223100 [Macrobrachium nipponense]|uniref:uncharacterized protein LOC135223100 n=1 Tax=Macrobrachium nipponense TaxID=159736 RepID=UPI0030C7B62E
MQCQSLLTKENEYVNMVNMYKGNVPETLVNFIMHPKKSYFSPLESLFPDSEVEQGLENMFSLESVGCSDNVDQHSLLDLLVADEFKKGIKFKDHKYHVDLPWKNDLIDQVPSNHKVALSILDRVVVSNLQQKGMLDAYQEVFQNQLKEGIIEEIDVNPQTFDKYIWIPHRPVIKEDPNTTTKIRPVFNCSLKTNNKPSLNEAAFAGVNLMRDIVQLLLYFRSNDLT